MNSILKYLRLGTALLVITVALVGASSNQVALAQTAPPAATAVALPEATINALQEASTNRVSQ